MAEPEPAAVAGRTSLDQLHMLAESMVLELPAVEEVLGEAVRAAASGGHACGITYLTRYGVLTVASSDETANAVDELQYETGDGPCLQALRSGEPVRVEDTAGESRWGRYPALALAAGIRSSLSYPLIVHEQSVGALNLYSGAAGPWSADEEATAMLISSQVAGILQAVRGIAADLIEDPETARAFRQRHDLDVAAGIMMAEHGCGNAAARDLLVGDAAARGVSIQAVVERLLTARSGPRPAP